MSSAIDSDALEKYFIKWVSHLVDLTDGEIIPIDGKIIRGAKSKGTKSPFHKVSGWASRKNMVLGQVKVSKKSNEITAIPELLDLIAIKDCTVTIDTMGCQKEIASEIITKEVNYISAVKENQILNSTFQHNKTSLIFNVTKLHSLVQYSSFQ